MSRASWSRRSAGLKREARQAEALQELSAEIRALQGAVLYARRAEAAAAAERAWKPRRAAAIRAVEETAGDAGRGHHPTPPTADRGDQAAA